MRTNYSDKELLGQRLAGVLPVIDIAGQAYIIDWRLKELRAEDDPDATIRLERMAMDANGENYLCFYHLPTRAVVNISPDITLLPTDMVMLEIPNELRLDPIGTARQYGLEDTFMLDRYPIKGELKARVIPVEETGLPGLIKANLSKQKSKQMKKRQKGKGL
jgi:hypothetical protein